MIIPLFLIIELLNLVHLSLKELKLKILKVLCGVSEEMKEV